MSDEETVEEIEDILPREEKINKTLGAYKRKMLLVEENNISVPTKRNYFNGTTVRVNENNVHSVIAIHDYDAGDLIDECPYIVMETRLNDFIESTQDKIGVRYLWTLPCEDERTYKCEKYGPHMVIPTGNALMYRNSDTPNCYYQFDDVTRTVRFYTLTSLNAGDEVTVSFGTNSFGPSGITKEEFSRLSGIDMVGFVPERDSKVPAKKGGCGCGAKKKFREIKPQNES